VFGVNERLNAVEHTLQAEFEFDQRPLQVVVLTTFGRVEGTGLVHTGDGRIGPGSKYWSKSGARCDHHSSSAAVATDVNRGVTDRFRSMPMGASAVVAGRAIADMLKSVVGLAVLLASGLLVGWRWHHGLVAALIAIGLLLLLRFAVLWVGIFLGLALRNPEALQAVQILVWPVAFLSNALAAPETMPAVLGLLVEWNPLSATVAATRELFGNPGSGSATWAAQHALILAVAWPLAAIALFLPLSVRRYALLSR
jgi:ABC-2 type transport system permease protein